MLGGIIAVIAVVLNSQGGFTEAFQKMKEAVPTAHDLENPLYKDFQPGDFASWWGPNAMSLLGVVVLTSLGTWGLPQMVGKFYSITDESAIKRVLIVFFIAISVLIALNPPTFIAQLMGISWGALAGAFLAPFLLGLYWRGVTTASVWACFIWGVGFTVVNMLMGNPINPIDCGAIAMVGGFPVVLIVSLVTKKLPQAKLDSIWKCYK